MTHGPGRSAHLENTWQFMVFGQGEDPSSHLPDRLFLKRSVPPHSNFRLIPADFIHNGWSRFRAFWGKENRDQ